MEKARSSVSMVPKEEVKDLWDELRLLQEEMSLLESEVDDMHLLEEEMQLLRGQVSYSDLEKTTHVDKIAKLEASISKLKSDPSKLVLKNMDLQASVTSLTGRYLNLRRI